MFGATIKGLLFGLSIGVLIGPIIFALLETTIEKGRKTGLVFASGIWFTDIIYVIAVNLIFRNFVISNQLMKIGGIIGGIVLIIFGITAWLSKIDTSKNYQLNFKRIGQAFVKGISINVFNPFVFVLWISIYSMLLAFNYNTSEKIAFYTAMLFVVAILDIIKIQLANLIAKQLANNKLLYVKKISAIMLVIFGIALIIKVYVV